MEIVIDKNKKLSVIQKEFQKKFPFLNIEFYKKPHSQGGGSAKENTLNTELTIENVQKKNASGVIKIHDSMTVTEFEDTFYETFGLAVQVFRKSGNIWLQTTTTDNWTLGEQSQIAIEKQEIPEESLIDYMDRQELE